MGARAEDQRFIPAGAGNTTACPPQMPLPTVHPRRRGEHGTVGRDISHAAGSSPQARGTPSRAPARAALIRFIPAGAGNTSARCGHWSVKTVHPRRRGEHTAVIAPAVSPDGSSPQARGTPCHAIATVRDGRFIPAGAGNTSRGPSRRPRSAVHPRRRGEHSPTTLSRCLTAGSSPQARGTRKHVRRPLEQVRFIPAGAGNTSSPGWRRSDRAVHPRRRGEHCSARLTVVRQSGSSPQARGTQTHCVSHRPACRFIPAGAGNTAAATKHRGRTPVHPRRRGEHEHL